MHSDIPFRKPARPLLARVLNALPSTRSSATAAEFVIKQCKALLSTRGEVSGRRLATTILANYGLLDADARCDFFDALVTRFSAPVEELRQAAEAFATRPSDAVLQRLQAAVEPPRQELFRRLNVGRSGTAALVAMRKDLVTALDAHPKWEAVDADLLHLFKSWFNPGFLVLEQIDWRTSAQVLERLIEYEAVHEIQGWSDLRRRLQADRRCYAYFHPALPDEPLIFIEVALTRAMVGHVQPLLDPRAALDDPAKATCAVFYSITNCQPGLRAVSFGNFLIKQVVELLSESLPRVTTYATVSPIPRFRAWLAARTNLPSHINQLLTLSDAEITSRVTDVDKEYLLGACAHYLMLAKRGDAPLDPVARFHLANGARLERLNWSGDSSAQGLQRSFGITANYVYRLKDVEKNHEEYANHKRVVASSAIRRLALNYGAKDRRADARRR